jgi:hypothetical protein
MLFPCLQPPDAGRPAHHFTVQYMMGVVLPRVCPRFSDVRHPRDVGQWPLSIVVDLLYVATVLRAWGPNMFVDHVRADSEDSYYEGIVEGEDASGDPIAQVPRARIRCRRRPADQRTRDAMFDLRLALWTRSAREARVE